MCFFLLIINLNYRKKFNFFPILELYQFSYEFVCFHYSINGKTMLLSLFQCI